jgi:threonine synthase
VSAVGLSTAVTVACAGCGHRATAEDPFPVVCPNRTAGDDIDHLMTRVLDPALVRYPTGEEPNPFVRYRTLFRAWHVARAAGWADERYVALVEQLDRAVAAVDGRGFRITPFARSGPLSGRLGFGAAGGVWIKDETGNVSGSHKARHLMGVMLELLVAEELGRFGDGSRPLAIASCGNAALAAAVVARAAGRHLDVFVPPSADVAVVELLEGLGARVTVCPREPGRPGDPSYQRLRAAIDGGAIPFTCQGNENGLAIEGGETLGFEMVSELVRDGRRLDAVAVQVGGGALASSVIGAFFDACELGVIDRLPRLYTVQTRGAFPLARAHERVRERLVSRLGWTGGPLDLADPSARAELAYVARHRSEFMWPWEEEPRSIAGGILDDETYDWLAVVRGMLASGGGPIVVDEDTLREANDLARARTGIDVDHTGTAGLAGLLELIGNGNVRADETVAVLFTGVRRGDEPPGATSRPAERRSP